MPILPGSTSTAPAPKGFIPVSPTSHAPFGWVHGNASIGRATTSASAIAAGQAVAAYEQADREPALFLLVLLTGAMLTIFGLLKVGRLVRYVPYSVMQGFLFGLSLVLVLDQLAPMVGYAPKGSNEITQFIDLLRNIGSWDVRAIVIGGLALALVVLLNRTRLANWSSLIGLVVPTGLLFVLGWRQLEQVVDVSPIPRGLPNLSLPDFSLLIRGWGWRRSRWPA